MDFINETSFSIISDYMPLTELLNISKTHAMKRIPSTINIKSVKEYDSFKEWCKLFNPSNITTVNISIPHTTYKLNCLRYLIDYVPTSVKTVNILKFDCVAPFLGINLPDNVEHLKINNTFADVNKLPANIKSLTLDYNFHGIVNEFYKNPDQENDEDVIISNLSYVELFGYNGGGMHPCPMNSLPDSIHTIKMYVDFPGQITYWPVNSIIIPVDPDAEDDETVELGLEPDDFDY